MSLNLVCISVLHTHTHKKEDYPKATVSSNSFWQTDTGTCCFHVCPSSPTSTWPALIRLMSAFLSSAVGDSRRYSLQMTAEYHRGLARQIKLGETEGKRAAYKPRGWRLGWEWWVDFTKQSSHLSWLSWNVHFLGCEHLRWNSSLPG